jgi:hypothetical protein
VRAKHQCALRSFLWSVTCKIEINFYFACTIRRFKTNEQCEIGPDPPKAQPGTQNWWLIIIHVMADYHPVGALSPPLFCPTGASFELSSPVIDSIIGVILRRKIVVKITLAKPGLSTGSVVKR